MNRFFAAAAIAALVLTCDLTYGQITLDAVQDTGTFAAGFNNGVPSFTSRNFGAHTHVPVGLVNNSDRVNRSFFEFDIVGSVPAGSTVSGVTFEFQVTIQGGPSGMGSDNFDLHLVTMEWEEGTGTGNVGTDTFDGVTWATTNGTDMWGNLGGDFDATPLGSTLVSGPNDYSISTPALVTYVQNIVDGNATDNGLLLKAATEAVNGSAARVTSREGGNAARLVVTLDTGVLIGDINLDGTVDLLDVGPFVTLLSTQMFQAEADINGDGLVDLLDVGGFVDLLSS